MSASQAERRRFESGHPLFSTELKSAEDQACGFSPIGWQGATRGLAMTGNAKGWYRFSHRASPPTAPLIS
jgi:hypothetical protein